MGLWVWVLYPQTHAHKPTGSDFLPINKPIDGGIDPYPCKNPLGFGFQVPNGRVPSLPCRANVIVVSGLNNHLMTPSQLYIYSGHNIDTDC